MSSIRSFRNRVWKYYKERGRHDLPWRQPSLKLRRGKKNFDPYRVMVSEIMLQQTQVVRVIEKYKEFLKAFPTVRALAKARFSEVLKVWSGLGYNRRGKYLHDAAKVIVEKYKGKVPRELASLRTLPGMGPYTASAVRVFAFNKPDTLIETNVRAAYIHHFYSSILQKTAITDAQVIPIATAAARGQDPRKWHWALMDYGVHIKKLHKNPARKSAHYTKQSKFEGSLRQVRGTILRELHEGKQPRGVASRLALALKGLERDGLIVRQKGSAQGGSASGRKWRIA
ncbi:hypothetical protein A3H16_03920 [Candidatus Kaiserbacteria bacterium RIFCSPLOWO2_12_FULL_53_8]|uniref:HhH-GPD domain-containing protein n=1 Tax=Candidatus Kaiserbacteria bacterium RIFCSPLOWO2_12_FULL_53_8 TaxID=1798529 RepID=A0A1F6G1L0_9BACT|nr:MAG: hypothetical protein A3H16_03920 [Candidatus Kaiserbacteria bacterium RIFCSPLOWO2_12_FULL_53_8]